MNYSAGLAKLLAKITGDMEFSATVESLGRGLIAKSAQLDPDTDLEHDAELAYSDEQFMISVALFYNGAWSARRRLSDDRVTVVEVSREEALC